MRSRWWVYVSRVILAMQCRSRCKGRRGRPLSTATRSSRPSILVQWKLDFEHLAEVEFALGPGRYPLTFIQRRIAAYACSALSSSESEYAQASVASGSCFRSQGMFLGIGFFKATNGSASNDPESAHRCQRTPRASPTQSGGNTFDNSRSNPATSE